MLVLIFANLVFAFALASHHFLDLLRLKMLSFSEGKTLFWSEQRCVNGFTQLNVNTH